MRIGSRLLLALLLVGLASSSSSSSSSSPEADGRGAVSLVWHLETGEGESLESRRADDAINPASIVKVATTLWALERLGPRHRFETFFGIRGELDEESGTLRGDLVVVGGADPDFHVDNVFLLARVLNGMGVRTVSGRLVVVGDFWIGWEGGSEGTLQDPQRRARRMALRLRDALDSRRWGRGTRREWYRFAARRGIQSHPQPRVVVLRGVATPSDAPESEKILVHRSNELVTILKRFNAYSNNDIERLGPSLGGPDELARFVAERWGLSRDGIRFDTLSGLGSNRMSPRQIVRLMHDLRATCSRLGLAVDDLLPVAGCDPGTLDAFPELTDGPAAKALTGKTGTLTYTDDGITALAGYLHTSARELVFCVAAPGSSGRISTARRAEERWVLERIKDNAGARSRSCGLAPWHSDADAEVVYAGTVGPPAAAAGRTR